MPTGRPIGCSPQWASRHREEYTACQGTRGEGSCTKSHVSLSSTGAQLLVKDLRAALGGRLAAIKLIRPHLHKFDSLGPIGRPIIGATNFVLLLMAKRGFDHI